MRRITVFIAAIILAAFNNNVRTQDLPSSKTLKTLLLANKYLIEKWPDPGKSINGGHASNFWTRSVYFEGLMALYKINPNEIFINYSLRWGQAHNWDLPSGVKTRDAGEMCCAQTYLDLYMKDRYREERIKNVRACIDSMIMTDKTDDWNSTDDLQMAMPVFARLGKIYNEEKYFDRMHEMYKHTMTKQGGNGLYNNEDKLWWADEDFDPPYKEPNGQNCYFSRGNGWVVAALVRTLEFLPKNSKYRKEYETTLREMFEALVPLQREDGFWNVSLKDPGNFGGKELSGTSLFVYSIAWAINEGLINRKDYLPVVTRAWDAILKDCVHEDGSLGYVQGTGREPKDGQPVGYDIMPDHEDFGLGCFLLAGSEMFRLQKSMEPVEKVKKVREEEPEQEESQKEKGKRKK